jgi:hypothetical protein
VNDIYRVVDVECDGVGRDRVAGTIEVDHHERSTITPIRRIRSRKDGAFSPQAPRVPARDCAPLQGSRQNSRRSATEKGWLVMPTKLRLVALSADAVPLSTRELARCFPLVWPSTGVLR